MNFGVSMDKITFTSGQSGRFFFQGGFFTKTGIHLFQLDNQDLNLLNWCCKSSGCRNTNLATIKYKDGKYRETSFLPWSCRQTVVSVFAAIKIHISFRRMLSQNEVALSHQCARFYLFFWTRLEQQMRFMFPGSCSENVFCPRAMRLHW